MYARLLIIGNRNTADRIFDVVPADRWITERATLGDGALAAVVRFRPDLIILDARQPNQSYAEFCRAIRFDMASVQLMVLVRENQADCIDLIESGADECWTEAVESRQFQVRMAAAYRRLSSSNMSRFIRHGLVELDLDGYTVRASGPPVHLTATQLKVLRYLMENAGVAISNEDLLAGAWGNPELDKGSVRTCVKRLRQILAATGAINVIRSVAGGYLFDTGTAPAKVPWSYAIGRPS